MLRIFEREKTPIRKIIIIKEEENMINIHCHDWIHITKNKFHGVNGLGRILNEMLWASFVRALQPVISHARGAYVHPEKLVEQPKYEIDESYLDMWVLWGRVGTMIEYDMVRKSDDRVVFHQIRIGLGYPSKQSRSDFPHAESGPINKGRILLQG